jgi:hypothetical protein
MGQLVPLRRGLEVKEKAFKSWEENPLVGLYKLNAAVDP